MSDFVKVWKMEFSVIRGRGEWAVMAAALALCMGIGYVTLLAGGMAGVFGATCVLVAIRSGRLSRTSSAAFCATVLPMPLWKSCLINILGGFILLGVITLAAIPVGMSLQKLAMMVGLKPETPIGALFDVVAFAFFSFAQASLAVLIGHYRNGNKGYLAGVMCSLLIFPLMFMMLAINMLPATAVLGSNWYWFGGALMLAGYFIGWKRIFTGQKRGWLAAGLVMVTLMTVSGVVYDMYAEYYESGAISEVNHVE